MFHRLILFVFVLNISVFASNKDFNNDLEKYLVADFYKFGIDYDKNTDKLVFSETDMLFKNGKSEIRKPFVLILNSFFPRYLDLLITHKVNIKKVIIKGHTSSRNRGAKSLSKKFKLNKVLSQKRANRFFQYAKNIQSDIVKENRDWIDKTFEAKGMSSSELVYDKNGKEDSDASRRIELEIIFNENLKTIHKKPVLLKPIDNTIYLADYVKRLLVESTTLKEKYNLLKSFQSDIDISKAAFYPTATLNFKQTEFTESTPDRFTDTQSKDITVRYNIFNGFKDLEENNIKQYNYKSNQYLKEQIEGDLIFSLTEAFISIQKQKDVLDLAKLNLEDYDLWISKEDIKFQNGVISLRNYSKIQSRDTTQRMNFQELNRQYRDTISTFSRYLDFYTEDIPFFEKLNPNNKYLENKDIAQYDIEKYSPYLKEAKQNIQLYKEKLEQSKVHFYPIVSLIAKKSILDENYETKPSVETEETSLALEAKIELYSGGKDRANNEKKLFEYREKLEKREDVLRDVKYKLDLAFNKYELTMKKELLLSNLILQREDSLIGASYDYKFAKIDANGLLDAVDDLYNAKKMYLENKYDLQISKYKIFNTIGRIKEMILEKEIK